MPRFFQLHSAICSRLDLDPAAKITFAVIESRIRFANKTWPGDRRLSAEAGLSRTGLRKAILQLLAVNLLVELPPGSNRARHFALGPAAISADIGLKREPMPTQLSDKRPLGEPLSALPVVLSTDPLQNPHSLKTSETLFNNEERQLPAPLLHFIQDLETKTGIRCSEKVALHFQGVILDEVPHALAIDQITTNWSSEKPWDIMAKISADWKQLRRAARDLHSWTVDHRGNCPDTHHIKAILRYLDDTAQLWAFGTDKERQKAITYFASTETPPSPI